MARIALSVLTLLLFVALSGCGGQSDANTSSHTATSTVELLNVSYDPTRELWKDLNAAYIAAQRPNGKVVSIKQSHGSSGGQARAVIDGLEADVVTLAMWSDTNEIEARGLIADGWEDRLPNRSLPYTSTIVFVVRKGNPKGIHDWADLVKPGVEVITPNPKTSGNGRLAFLGAWGSVILAGKSEADAKAFVTTIYHNVPVLDTGARGSTTSFAQRGMGDVHLTWENEAHLEVAEANGELEIVFPSVSILAEPHVAVVDAVVDRKGTRLAAEDYLQFLYTPAGQEIIAKHYYRPSDAQVLARHNDKFPAIELFPITALTGSWQEAHTRFFADGGVFDQIYEARK